MSYRAFKRLFGETRLEFKFRFVFGIGIIGLITLSFWFYAAQTEHLAYEQAKITCRLLIEPIIKDRHAVLPDGERIGNLFEGATPKEQGKDHHYEYQYKILQENQTNLEPYERELFKDFASANPDSIEYSKVRASEQVLLYYAPLRAGKSCLHCHGNKSAKQGPAAASE